VSTYRVVLPHPTEPRLLMMHTHGEWRLPEWDDATSHGWQATAHVNRAVAARYGMETTVLRCILNGADPVTGRPLRVYELDNHSAPHDTVAAATWVGRSDIDMLRIAEPEMREIVAEWFGRNAGELPWRGPPWAHRGWYVEALAWSIARLTEIGATVDGSPEQLRAWQRSFLMRIRTSDGAFYLKAGALPAVHEGTVMRVLGRHYPDNVPEVVAVDEARGWFLQREARDAALPLDEVREEQEWCRAMRRLAGIQVDSIRHVDALRAAGCPHRGLEVLARRIPRLCADAGAMLLGHAAGLSRREIEQVAALAPTLLSLCEDLADCGLPDALEHGDLRAGNVLSTLSGPIYLDWSDSSISHPFFSAIQPMTDAAGLVPGSSIQLQRLMRTSYLTPWRELAPERTLQRAFDLARILAPVHSAATAHAELLPAAGHRWELEKLVPAHLRTALRLLLEEPDAAGAV
jgi:hypothetical protein